MYLRCDLRDEQLSLPRFSHSASNHSAIVPTASETIHRTKWTAERWLGEPRRLRGKAICVNSSKREPALPCCCLDRGACLVNNRSGLPFHLICDVFQMTIQLHLLSLYLRRAAKGEC
ncbi:hypothetical protein Mal33_04640 [Rosistilla oblonga]|uniref:Uncharacterized protein n=1 Tax=Rosistilla oblonga TaxID=2527990 RepID=A0A518IN47_9BACT|nr:hypothetical protein Mal33_04640 [Rosistilla oblonga]